MSSKSTPSPQVTETSPQEVFNAALRLMTNCSRAFAEATELPRTAANERLRYQSAIWVVGSFFLKLKAPFAGRFFELGLAIGDLNSGIKCDLLTPSLLDNRRPDASQLWIARAHIAVGLSALIQTGRGLDDAAAEIASKYPQFKEIVGAKAQVSFKKTIEGWRKVIMSKRVNNFAAAELFEMGTEIIELLSIGLRAASNVIDERFQSNVIALYAQTDDCIFFCRKLADDLFEYGTRLRRRNAWKFRLGVPKMIRENWEFAEQQGLMPDESLYEAWLRGFPKQPGRIERLQKRFLTRSNSA